MMYPPDKEQKNNRGRKEPRKKGDYTMERIAPSERTEQKLMKGLVSSGDPLGEAAGRGPNPFRYQGVAAARAPAAVPRDPG